MQDDGNKFETNEIGGGTNKQERTVKNVICSIPKD
jgi:hypothetical protein